MVTNFNYKPENLFTPVIFRKDFSNATISATQAWSLFFSAGQEENLFGQEKEIGWFYNNVLLAGGVAFALAAIFFSAPLSPLF
ncbi:MULTISPECIES: hypothetical protein [Cyanophyceae]|uniref:hypothetical protein n=1 Tax=Cyanophyceae TaxID=3028117 RepID=UPI00016DC45E|nr:MULTISPECIES: hypothetical protein [Cyanophyceae]ACA99235.1 hypothetical protein SYNPCC7002_A1237 [Picosynechococcus sp. PCC 7002]AMA08965.1 hypothetical protein AWQ23_06360 [Picosynechococcus sp. PCC 73109]ANV87107.1 hypothetical protein AWQ22_06325 [Picosynechococcus sp. PCC 7117]ANV90259.1 hypothetical protein AWQ24_06270 [Picosynechococcus sp. PCC 8807]QCS49804.1 hypothetical protein FEK30_10335 [Picosynechococcus sp. PCC 11901]